jgi:hypothetical protein
MGRGTDKEYGNGEVVRNCGSGFLVYSDNLILYIKLTNGYLIAKMQGRIWYFISQKSL